MNEFFQTSLYFGMFISIIGYWIGLFISKKLKLAIFNPLLIAVLFIIGTLKLLDINYETYDLGAKYLSYLLTPATVCLAIPLYQQFQVLKDDFKAIMISIVVGVLTSMGSILLFSLLFKFSHEQYVTFLPKSITTAISMSLSKEMGGIETITSAAVLVTGITGNVIAPGVMKLLKIKDPVARGLAIGTSSHAIGTTKALEMGEIEGAMSSLAIVVAGVVTVVFASFFAMLI